MAEKKLFLVDGSYMFYRAYFALMKTPLFNKKGENTTATYGFLNQIFKIIQEQNPEYFAVAFDTKEPTFRHEQFEAYKATREKMPEDMAAQYPRIVELVRLLGIPVLEFPGYEADDVIGTLAIKAAAKSFEVYLVTADKDYMQLVNEKIRMYNPWGKNGAEIYDARAIEEKLGLTPEQIVDYLALMGDSSDNVPGVKGVGQKTAIALLKEYQNLDKLYEQLDTLNKKALKEKLIEGKDSAYLSRDLVTIHTDVPIHLAIEDLKRQPPRMDEVIKIFKELEFQSFIERLPDIFSEVAPTVQKYEAKNANYHLIKSETELKDLVNKLKQCSFFVFDTETTGLNVWESDIIGFSFAMAENEAYYVPFLDHYDLPKETVQRYLAPIFENKSLKKGAQNIKFDSLMLHQHGIEIEGMSFDTMVADYLLNPGSRSHNLDAMALKYLNYKMIPIEELIGKRGKSQKSMAELSPEAIYEYACEDADVTFKLVKILKEKLMEYNLLKLFNDVEMPLIEVLLQMEINGVKLDLEHLKQLSNSMSARIKEIEQEIYKMCGKEFNIKSTQQLGKILYEEMEIHKEMNIKRIPKTAKGSYSTSESALEKFAGHPIVDLILEYRKLNKLKNTYIDAFPGLISSRTGRLHASFNQTITATGRLSSSDPNLQNIPIRTDIGKEIRKAFIPENLEDYILSADYSQIELRILAELSGDENLLSAFENNEDIHTSTASKIFGIKPDEVTPDHRRKAKEINFGIIYGMNEYGLASRLGISPDEAKGIIQNYFAQFPKVHDYIIGVIVQASRKKYVETILGRRRYIPEIDSKDRNTRENAERQAINTTIQGSAADLIKLAMIDVHKYLKRHQKRTKMIIQIHDELVFEVPANELDEMKKIIPDKMERAMALKVPLKVDVGYGKNWLEAHE